MPSRLFPVSYDLFKALVALVLFLLLVWLWPKAPPPTLSVAVDPSGAVTLEGEAPRGKTVRLTFTDATGRSHVRDVRADDGGRWLTAVQLEPGSYSVTAAAGPAAAEPLRFTVPQPARLAPLTIDPVPASVPAPLTLSGQAEPGRTLLLFVDGRPAVTDPPVVAGPDGRWTLRMEASPGGHTVYVAYAEAPEQTSNLLTLELIPARVSETPASASGASAGSEAESIPAAAAATTAGRTYVVQEDDWLSKLAEEFLGDPGRYPEISKATNAKAAEDDSFATIEDDHLIYPGEKIWIPAP